MISSAFSRPGSVVAVRLVLAVLLSWATSIFAAPTNEQLARTNDAKNLARLSCGAQIEFFGPNGQVSRVTADAPSNAEAAALVMEDNTVGCSLPQGDSKFVITLP